jgi:hypothetical protein
MHYDLQCSPQDYLPQMLYMMKAVEARGAAVNNTCPLRSAIIPNHFRIDTTSLVKLCLTSAHGTQIEYLTNITMRADERNSSSPLVNVARLPGQWARTVRTPRAPTIALTSGLHHPVTTAKSRSWPLAVAWWRACAARESTSSWSCAHNETLTSAGNLATSLMHQQRYAEAEEILRDVLLRRMRVFGEDHHVTLIVAWNLASAVSHQGRHAEAEAVQRRVLQSQVQVLGECHPDTLLTAEYLATSLTHMCDHAGATRAYRGVVRVRRRALGDDHPDTLTSILSLGMGLRRLGEHEEAERVLRELLCARTRVLGRDHVETLRAESHLASTLVAAEKFADAEVVYRRMLGVLRRDLGDGHKDTLATIRNLVAVVSHVRNKSGVLK